MRTSHRFVALVAADVALLVLSATLAGGATDPPSTPTKTASASAPARGGAAQPLRPADARRIAAAGVLGRADMPGYVAVPAERDATAEAADRQFQRCLGLGEPKRVARDHGMRFMKGATEVDSSVDVVRSPALARKGLAALAGPRVERCFKAALADVVTQAGAALTQLSLTPVKVRVQGADAAVAHRLSFVMEGGGRQLQVRGFLLAAVVGPAEISITVLAPVGTSGLSLDDAVRLLSTASSRTRAAL